MRIVSRFFAAALVSTCLPLAMHAEAAELTTRTTRMEFEDGVFNSIRIESPQLRHSVVESNDSRIRVIATILAENESEAMVIQRATLVTHDERGAWAHLGDLGNYQCGISEQTQNGVTRRTVSGACITNVMIELPKGHRTPVLFNGASVASSFRSGASTLERTLRGVSGDDDRLNALDLYLRMNRPSLTMAEAASAISAFDFSMNQVDAIVKLSASISGWWP